MNGLVEYNQKLYGLRLAKWRRQDRMLESIKRVIVTGTLIVLGVLVFVLV